MTGSDVIDKVIEIAMASPNNVYRSGGSHEPCAYLSGSNLNGSIGCLIGQALVALGCNRAILEKFDELNNPPGALIPDPETCSLQRLLAELHITFTDKDLEWLAAVQSQQDCKDPWGSCLAENEKLLPCREHWFRSKPVAIQAYQWFKNGDHPLDEMEWIETADGEKIDTEGKIVRRFRRPDVPGNRKCKHCEETMHEHGWIDTLEGGHIVCPGDWIVTGLQGEHYPVKPLIFIAKYERII